MKTPVFTFLLDFANLFNNSPKTKKRYQRILTSPFKIAFPYLKKSELKVNQS